MSVAPSEEGERIEIPPLRSSTNEKLDVSNYIEGVSDSIKFLLAVLRCPPRPQQTKLLGTYLWEVAATAPK